ncbi:Sister chromatid cohesion 1 protein 4 [Camellia lanceoleosa]|uniref:Sister chromatid cohesion 1 protein 4 n=1 Tax=Camellia lanceoleosa TaxID=1840588 RepID=A0ACC0F4J5_9ERIC|nr:Sister chromatid cohesion 1 protein 4 [Camellia lanceoleosa]
MIFLPHFVALSNFRFVVLGKSRTPTIRASGKPHGLITRYSLLKKFSEFEDDPHLYVLKPIKYVGIEVWQIEKDAFEKAEKARRAKEEEDCGAEIVITLTVTEDKGIEQEAKNALRTLNSSFTLLNLKASTFPHPKPITRRILLSFIKSLLSIATNDYKQELFSNKVIAMDMPELSLDSVWKVFFGNTDFIEYAQAPCTPGLMEEPNLSKVQEASACDDHLELGEESNLSNILL